MEKNTINLYLRANNADLLLYEWDWLIVIWYWFMWLRYFELESAG